MVLLFSAEQLLPKSCFGGIGVAKARKDFTLTVSVYKRGRKTCKVVGVGGLRGSCSVNRGYGGSAVAEIVVGVQCCKEQKRGEFHLAFVI